MLYATESIKSDEDFNKAMVGIASIWYASPDLFRLPLMTRTRSGTKAIRKHTRTT